METDFGLQVPAWYQDYVKNVIPKDYIEVMRDNYELIPATLLRLPVEHWDYAYAPGKWTIKEILLHMTDAERIFSYRALRFARNDKTELEGFDENAYTPNSHARKRSEVSLIEEYKAVRNATLAMFTNFDDEMLERTGIANENEFSVRMIGYIIAGHELHHWRILGERYQVGKI